jgi:hypothetical protein
MISEQVMPVVTLPPTAANVSDIAIECHRLSQIGLLSTALGRHELQAEQRKHRRSTCRRHAK